MNFAATIYLIVALLGATTAEARINRDRAQVRAFGAVHPSGNRGLLPCRCARINLGV